MQTSTIPIVSSFHDFRKLTSVFFCIILLNWKGRRAGDPITDCTGDRHIDKPQRSNDGEVANPTTPKFQSLSE